MQSSNDRQCYFFCRDSEKYMKVKVKLLLYVENHMVTQKMRCTAFPIFFSNRLQSHTDKFLASLKLVLSMASYGILWLRKYKKCQVMMCSENLF